MCLQLDTCQFMQLQCNLIWHWSSVNVWPDLWTLLWMWHGLRLLQWKMHAVLLQLQKWCLLWQKWTLHVCTKKIWIASVGELFPAVAREFVILTLIAPLASGKVPVLFSSMTQTRRIQLQGRFGLPIQWLQWLFRSKVHVSVREPWITRLGNVFVISSNMLTNNFRYYQ